jgi:hypothetical protein
MPGARHQCMIHEGAPFQQFHRLSSVIAERLKSNYRCFYANHPEMVAGMRLYLDAHGLDVAGETERGALVLTSEQTHLIDGRFDANRILSMLEWVLDESARDGFAGVWGSGDVAWELGSDLDVDKLIAYERGAEEVSARRPELQCVCLYRVDALPRDFAHPAFSTHRSIYVDDATSLLNPYYDPQKTSRAHVEDMLSWRRLAAMED